MWTAVDYEKIKVKKIQRVRVDLLPSPAKSRGIQIMGTYFHSKNFQGPKLYIKVNFLFAKAREKVIFAAFI